MPNISLTKPLEHFVNSQIKVGRFGNLSEAVRAGLWLLIKQERGAERFYELREEFAELAAQADRGEAEPFDFRKFEPALRRKEDV